nr:response regulator [uncultured Allomuricauda sp.]
MQKPLVRSIRSIVLYFLSSLFSFFSFSVVAQKQVGQPKITNYYYQDYGAQPVNWWVLEGDDGIMYFANTSGVLEFDGVSWRTIPLKNYVSARSLAKDDNGTIFVAGEGELGYLGVNDLGELNYVSLKDKIPEEHRALGTVWEVDYFKGRMVYRTNDKLYIWDGNTFEVVVPEGGLHVGQVVHDKLYIRIWGKGLCIYENGKLNVVPEGEKFTSERIYTMLPYDDKTMLVGTRTQGFYLYDGKTFKPFKTELDELVKGSLYLPGVALDDGRFVFNTFSNGAYLMSHDGELLQSYIVDTGLQDGTVDYSYVDSRGVLWLAIFKGISKVDLNSPFTYVTTASGLGTSSVLDAHRLNDFVYFTTGNGIYYLKDGDSEVKFMEGTIGQGGNFTETRGRLYTGLGAMGMFEIKGKTFEYVRKSIDYNFRSRYSIISTYDENRMFAFHEGGITSLYFDESENQFVFESEIAKNPNGGFFEDSDGNIWLGSRNDSEILLLDTQFNGSKLNLDASKVKVYDVEDGLPKDVSMSITRVFGEPHFFSSEGKTYAFDKENQKFFENKFFYSELISLENPGFLFPELDSENRFWFNVGSGITIAKKNEDGTVDLDTETLRELKNTDLINVHVEKPKSDGSQIAWFSGPDGIIRYSGKMNKRTLSKFDLKIRSMKVAGDSLIYAGSKELPKDLKLDFQNNTLSFDYAAPLFIAQNNMQYTTKLDGLNDKWSDWSKQTTREYINLPAGSYTFNAKAKSLFGDETEVTSFTFTVAPPWYKTWWAYSLYALGILGFIYFSVKARTKILLNQQKELEEKVQERTKESNQRLSELATVNQVSKALNDKLELDALIQLVGNQMKEVFKSDITYLAILNPDTGIIDFPYQDGDDMPPMKYGEGLTSKIIQTGEPLLINKDTDIKAEYTKSGIQQTGKQAISYLGVPIPVEDVVIGVLSVQSVQHESRFNDEDKRLLNTIAINVGIALHNAELYEDAKQAKAKAEDANEAKSAFLSTVSHELRTPLTSVLGFAKIIRKRLEDKIFPAVTVDDQKIKRTMKQVSENLDVVVSEGERLTNLINDVLDLAKIESGKMEWNMRPVFLQDVIHRGIAATSSLFEQKSLVLKKNIPEDLPIIKADEDKLIQVIINLLSNAVKFTEKGTVSVEAYQDKGQLIFEVQDTGIGVAEKDKHKIFERFRQAGDTLTDKPQGTGLGLPICREIIEHHGGIIWMKSEFNVGSTFFFSIPLLGEAAVQEPIQLDRILRSLKKQISHSSKKNEDGKPTILVVDDDTPIRSLLRQELSDTGYRVREAANGKAALDMVRLEKPDLIILDVMMPEINGFDVAAVLKNDPSTMDIPIIILSIVQDKERGFRIGVDRYLTKPIDTEKLFHEVDELLEQGVSKKKVLVVDEDASAVKTLTEVLSARGYKVMKANTDNLLQTASEAMPDIIMLNSVYNGDKNFIKDLKVQKGMENVMFFVYE